MGSEVGILRLEGGRLGRYRVVRRIGSGGMGVVYEGVDEELRRRVAVKVLWPHLASDPEVVARFQREARAAARLRHPNIVQVYDVGVEGGVYYHVIEYVEGKPLSQVLQERGRFTVEETVKLLRPVAAALDYAHRQGVIHRDVKPGNIMVGAGGKAVLMDLGLAKVGEGRRVTQTGEVMGSPAYMAPEQVKGEEVGPWTDVYSLGVVVYEMLTGHLPFEGGMMEMLLGHVEGEPAPMRRWEVRVAGGVEWAVQKALAKRPGDRWRSCEEFLQALERPGVGRLGEGDRFRGVVAVGVALLVMMGMVGLWILAETGEGPGKKIPTEATLVTPTGTSPADFAGTKLLLPPDTPSSQSNMPALFSESLRFPVSALPGTAGTVTSPRPVREIKVVETSPKMERETVVPSGAGSKEPVPPEARLGELTLLGTGMGPVVWGSDRDHVFLASGSSVFSYDLLSSERSQVLELSSRVFAVAIGPDGRTLAVGDWKGSVILWDLQRAARVAHAEGHQGGPLGGTLALVFSPDGALLASGGTDGRILLWDTRTLSLQRACEGHASWVRSLAFSPDGNVLASGALDNTVRLWDRNTCREVRDPLLHDDWVMDVAFSPTGDMLASASWDGKVRLWGADGSSPRTLVPDSGAREVLAMAFSPAEEWLLVSGDLEGTVRFWDVKDGHPIAAPKTYGEPVVDLAFSPDGKDVVCALRNGDVKLLGVVKD